MLEPPSRPAVCEPICGQPLSSLALPGAAAVSRQVMFNLPVEQMHAPVVGPLHHNQKHALSGAPRAGAARA